VPFGGIYRIIDFTLSNCLNSGLRRVHVLTQYKSYSLDRHLKQAWGFLQSELGEYVAAEWSSSPRGSRSTRDGRRSRTQVAVADPALPNRQR
jgi:ADP-glucose pyrophosphorylase